jgi:uncharacterized membrane protein YqjE
MSSADRPFSELFSNIFGNVEDIVRSELKLAKTEVREDLAKSAHAAAWFAVGLASALFALGFLLLTVFFLLLSIVPNWAAALIIAVPLGLVSTIIFQVGGAKRKLQRNSQPLLAETPSKENSAWAKHQPR